MARSLAWRDRRLDNWLGPPDILDLAGVGAGTKGIVGVLETVVFIQALINPSILQLCIFYFHDNVETLIIEELTLH